MSLLDLWHSSPEQLTGKHVQQLIAFAGAGRLMDESQCSAEFRAFLARVSTSSLKTYADHCLGEPFQDSGLALQDVVNEIGARLGAVVSRGRYRGTTKHVGYDGLWQFATLGNAIIVEVKTTDAYRIDLTTLATYRKRLVDDGTITESASSILLVVGRQDTGDLEAQIRGSRHAWDIRIISVGALLSLLETKEELEDPRIVQQIHSILVPREFTKLDEIANILFSAAQDIRQEVEVESGIALGDSDIDDDGDGETNKPSNGTVKTPKFVPMAFHEDCAARVQMVLGEPLVKRSRGSFSSPDDGTRLICSVSREHDPDSYPNYWFSFHPHQQEFLKATSRAYLALGCGSSERVLLMPFAEFEPLLEGMWITHRPDRSYWHLVIHRRGEKYELRRRKGEENVDVTKYLLSATPQR